MGAVTLTWADILIIFALIIVVSALFFGPWWPWRHPQFCCSEVGRVATQLETKFERFHKNNPDVYKQFATLCYELWQSDIRQFAASSILTVIRFNHALAHHNTLLKIDPAFSSRYAEMLTREDTRFNGFFKQES